MLKKLRLIVAQFFLIAITLLFLDYTGTVHGYLGWCAKIQFFPAILAMNIAVIAGVILVTLLFGRVYCSIICPLGLWQDKVSRIAGIGRKNRFSYRPRKKTLVVLRFAILGVFVVFAIAGVAVVPVLLEPYGAYGRMVSQIAGPLYKYGNNILAGFAKRAGSYAFFTTDVWLTSVGALIVAVLTLAVTAVFAVKSGRGYCNCVCPIGTFLGYCAKFAVMQPRINEETCTSCGVCATNCKAGCINSSCKEIDYTRCVACFNCMCSCPTNAVKYASTVCMKKASGNNSFAVNNNEVSTDIKKMPASGAENLSDIGLTRRGLVSGAALLAFGFITRTFAANGWVSGNIARLEDKRASVRSRPVIPPGADNIKNFRRRCTGCQLCVIVCPNRVLRPSSKLSEFMQPHMSFERGYCRPECVKCSKVCPTGAIRPITTAEKSATQIGIAVWRKRVCLVNAKSVQCDLCARRCPVSAITMIPQSADAKSLKIPMVDTARCTGCGACEHLCPARPYSAIYVEGLDTHRVI